MADTLEDKVNAPHAEEKHEEKPKVNEKPQTPLEEIVSGIDGIAKMGLAAAAPFALGSISPSITRDAAIMAGAQVAADATTSIKRKEKYTPGNILESSLLGTAIAGPLEAMFGLANKMPLNSTMDYVSKAAAWGGLAYPAFIGMYQTMAYVIRNRTLKGLGTYLKENYFKTLWYAWTRLLPFSLANVFLSPPWLQIPVAAGLSYLFDLFGAPKHGEIPEDRKRVPGQYLKSIPSAVGKAAKTVFYGVPEVFYNAGKKIADLTYSSESTPAAPSPHPA